jgi:acid phosphatase (class A)
MRARAFALLLALSSTAQAAPLDDIHYGKWGKLPLKFCEQQSYFLPRAELLALEVADPPANSSESTRHDLDELLELQKNRTKAQRAAIESHLEFPGVMATMLAAAHRKLDKAPETKALLLHVERDATVAVFNAKKRFNRARPHQLEPKLKPCIDVPPHPAYPSGHAIWGEVVARTLAEIFPDDRAAITAAGVEIGHEREIAGVHYASDSAASRALGEDLFGRLMKNEKFQRELAAAKAEWAARSNHP